MDKEATIKDLMYHQDANKRRAAAEELFENAEFDREVLEAFVHGVMDPDPGVKDICSRALSKAQSEDAYKAAVFIAPFIAHKDIEIRNLCSDILQRIGEPALDPLLPFLEEDDPFVRQFALDIVGNIGNEKAKEPVARLLDDNDPNVRSSAIEAIGNLKFEDKVDDIISRFNKEEDLNPIIIESIGKIGGKKAEEFLSEIIRNEDDFFLKTAAIDSFSLCGSDYDICIELLDQLDKTPDELQTTLLKTIYAVAYRNDYEIKLPDELRHIAHKALLEEDADIRGAGLVALGNSYKIQDVPSLINEVLKYNEDTQQMILYNLLVNSPKETIKPFFKEFMVSPIPDGSFLEFFSLFTPFWEDVDKENADEVIEVLFDDIFTITKRHAEEMIEMLLQLNEEKTIVKLREHLASKDKADLEEIIEITGRLKLTEFKEDLESIKNKGIMTDTINDILNEWQEENK